MSYAPSYQQSGEPGAREVFAAIRQSVGEDARRVDQLILTELNSDVVLINQIGHYIVNSGGKRLRPLLHLVGAKALGYEGQDNIVLAAVIEFIHTATLLHDDVVDESSQRRGKDTANALWGNSASVLVGDFLYSRSFEMMVRTRNIRAMDILSFSTTAIAEGEVLQLLNCNNPATDEAAYLRVVSRKTAILFSAAAQLSAVLVGADQATEDALKAYGDYLGTAFQLIDDALDYTADQDELGKNLGDDLAEGKPTLPLIHALSQAGDDDAAFLRSAIEHGRQDAFERAHSIILATGAIAYTEKRAREMAEQAIASVDCLPDSQYRSALIDLAHYSVQRTY